MTSKRLVKLCVACSIDGYIAGPAEEIDWLFDPGEIDLSAFFGSIDTVVMGRRTYDFAVRAGHGAAQGGWKTYVFTRDPKPPDDASVEFVAVDPRELVESLRREDGRDVWLMGGGELLQSFLAADLVDEMLLGVHPIVLGGGVPLFPGRHGRTGFELAKCEALESGLVHLEYRRARAGA